MISVEATRKTLFLLDEVEAAASEPDQERTHSPRAAEVLRLIMEERTVPPDAEAAALDAFEVGAIAMLAGNTEAPKRLLSEIQPPPTDWYTEVLSITATAWLRLASGDPDAARAASEAHAGLAERQRTQEKHFLDASSNPRQAAFHIASAYFMSIAVRQAAGGELADAAETLARAMRFADRAAVTLWVGANWLKAAVRAAPPVDAPATAPFPST